MGLFEVNEAAEVIANAAHSDANVIFGAVIDQSLGDQMRVTVIATGFDRARQAQKETDKSIERPVPGLTELPPRDTYKFEMDEDILDIPNFLKKKK